MSGTIANKDLQVGISNREILKIALPISLALLVPQVNFFTNNIFLSGLGAIELGTAAITGVYYLVFALIGSGLNAGLQGLISRRAGENRPEEIGRLYSQSQWIALFFAAAGIMITFLFAPYFLEKSLRSDTVQEKANSFIALRIWGLPFLYLFQTGNALLVGTNNSRYMIYGFIAMAGSNIFLDYTLIYGEWGFPEMGFNGAALASVIAEMIGASTVFIIIYRKKLHERFSLFKKIKYDPPLGRLIFVQSSPLVAQYLLSVGAWLLFFILIEHKGELDLAISNAMRNVFGLFGVFIWAFASTTNAMVSNIIGQGLKDKVVLLIKKIMLLSFIFTFVLTLFINLLPKYFLDIYGQKEEFITQAIPVLRIVTLGMLSMSIALIWLYAVTGTGNTRMNLLIEAVAIIIYTIYVWLVLKLWDLSLGWAWFSEVIYWGSLFLFSFLYIRGGKWRKKVL